MKIPIDQEIAVRLKVQENIAARIQIPINLLSAVVFAFHKDKSQSDLNQEIKKVDEAFQFLLFLQRDLTARQRVLYQKKMYEQQAKAMQEQSKTRNI